MKKHTLLLATFILFINFSSAQLIFFEGKNYFINGANIPWKSFGSDVGAHYQWGTLYDSTWFENTFSDCENYGINCVRLWIHCDGRSSPEFNSSGYVTGLDTNFFSHFDDIMLRAKKHNLMIMPCLWSFDMTKDFTSGAGIYAGLHADLIKDTLKTNSYINNALIPMVQRYANACNLLAWEIINEPEWSMTVSGGGNTFQTVSASQMQRFVGMQAKAIHQHSNKMVTVGSASLKWNSDIIAISTPCVGNFWKNQQIQNAYNHPLAYLDFYQIHYYSWMHAPWIFDPINLNYPYNYWLLDKPALIGEIGAIDPDYSNATILSNAYNNNFAGIMFWSINGNDGHGTFNDFKNQVKYFRDNHTSIVDFACLNTSSNQSNYTLQSLVYPTITNSMITIEVLNNEKTTLTLNDISGKKVLEKEFLGNKESINIDFLQNGVYFLILMNSNKNIIIQKIIKY